MAEDKKAPVPKAGTFESLVWLIFFLLIASAIFARLSAFFAENVALGSTFSWSRIAFLFSHTIGPKLSMIAFTLSTFFIFGIAWTVSKLSKLNAEIAAVYDPLPSSSAGTSRDVNPRWQRVLEHLNSLNPNDWKFAILEADIILDDLLTTLQRPGVTIAEKLKSVEPSDFTTLDQAWEAHKIRNMIAHEGADFTLTDREARRVIDLYRVVFEEFHII